VHVYTILKIKKLFFTKMLARVYNLIFSFKDRSRRQDREITPPPTPTNARSHYKLQGLNELNIPHSDKDEYAALDQ
jgi:hypothetical protein